MRELTELTRLSNRYGADPRYVLAGGGNTSCKIDGVLYVKGSGVSLAEIREEQFVAMDMAKLSAMLRAQYPPEDDAREAAALRDVMAARLPGEEAKRPSVEAILHAIFPHRLVVHVHPALVNGLSCGADGPRLCRELLGEAAVWVPLTKPGYILARECTALFAAHEKETGRFPQIVILQNHGLFVASDTVEEIDRLMAYVMDKLEKAIDGHPDGSPVEFDRGLACSVAPVLRMLFMEDGSKAFAVFCTSRLVKSFVGDGASIRDLTRPFTPDHIVYCRHTPLVLTPDTDIGAAFSDYRARHGFPPRIAAVQGLGFFALGKSKKDADTARDLFLDAMAVASYARSFGGSNPLPDDFTHFILNWEAESYRQSTSPPREEGRLNGKIAIVTGGAQGFGRGIAQALAGEGACVAVADRNEEGAASCAHAINMAHGMGTSLAVGMDVTDEESVRAMVETCVLTYGGLDLLVSNAGVLQAGGLEELSKAQFEFVTSVNYTGYFLCVKYAVAPMKLQRRYRPGYTTDIVEINSKSGLAGSNRNFAYAGSKFGGVGLTQSFALELVADGIKVNAVCPGNLLDGPLWSDPERGLFRQYLDAGKVPGAKTVEDVRRFYEAKVPMNRGCAVSDVVRAILYAVEQQYETGQAIPVTGGQIMLS